jgi:hypothetical protein
MLLSLKCFEPDANADGAVLFNEGDNGEFLFFIVDGDVSVSNQAWRENQEQKAAAKMQGGRQVNSPREPSKDVHEKREQIYMTFTKNQVMAMMNCNEQAEVASRANALQIL